MGEWYDYKLRVKEKNITDLIEQSGIAKVKMLTPSHNPNAEPVPRLVFPSQRAIYHWSETAEKEDRELIIGIEGSDIFYCSKWQPDDKIADYICENLPDEIVQVDCYAPYYDKDVHWLRKGSIDINKEGEPVNTHFLTPTQKQVKEKNGNYLVSLPIGTENELWGTIIVPPKNIIGDNDYSRCVFFSEETVLVRFKNHNETMTPIELVEKVNMARDAYRDEMRRTIQITGLSPDAFRFKENDMGNYYIINIPCEPEISSDGFLRLTNTEYSTQPENGKATLGAAGRNRSVIVMDDEGHLVKKSMKLSEIERTFLATRQPELSFPQEAEAEER